MRFWFFRVLVNTPAVSQKMEPKLPIPVAEPNLVAPVNPAPVRSFVKTKWQYIVASVIGLVGAFFGGVFGSLIAAFAGDSWWPSEFALGCFQYAAVIGGVCVGAVPGMIWLLCLRQKWVLPVIGVGTGALLLPVLERMSISNHAMGLLYAGVVALGFVLGFVFWMVVRRRAKG